MTPQRLRALLCVAAPLLIAAVTSTQHPEKKVLRHVLAQAFTADNTVLEIVAPGVRDRERATLGWNDASGAMHGCFVRLRAGRHLYDLRPQAGWRGPVQALATDVPGLRASLRRPTLADEMAIFAAPEPMVLSSVNFSHGHTLFGWRWHWLLAAGFLLGAGALWLKRVRLPVALTISFAIACGLMQLRAVVDHHRVIDEQLSSKRTFPVELQDPGVFGERCAHEIGEHSWSIQQNLAVTPFVYLRYRMAEHRFLPRKLGRADYFIGRRRARGQVVAEQGALRLVELEK